MSFPLTRGINLKSRDDLKSVKIILSTGFLPTRLMPKRQGVFFWDPFLNVRPKLKRWPLSGLWIFNKLWINPKLQVPGSVLPESTLDQIFPSVKLCQDAFDPLRRDSWPRKRDKSREKGEDTWVRAAQCEKCRNVGTTQFLWAATKTDGQTDGPIKSSARGPRGPKKTKQRKLCSYANKQKNLHFIIASHLYSVLLLLINAKKKH